MENPTMLNIDSNTNDDNNNNASRTRGGRGRRKVEMKKIEDKTSLIVTFSKRKSGLQKKTEQINKKYGVNAAVITFSPMGKSFIAGNVDSVVETYLRRRGGRKEAELKEEGTWWQRSIEGMNKEELKEFKDALIVFGHNLEARLEDLSARDEQTRDFLSILDQNHELNSKKQASILTNPAGRS